MAAEGVLSIKPTKVFQQVEVLKGSHTSRRHNLASSVGLDNFEDCEGLLLLGLGHGLSLSTRPSTAMFRKGFESLWSVVVEAHDHSDISNSSLV